MQTKGTAFFCQRDNYDHIVRKYRTPDLANKTWDAIFVQTCSFNRKLEKGTRVLVLNSK